MIDLNDFFYDNRSRYKRSNPTKKTDSRLGGTKLKKRTLQKMKDIVCYMVSHIVLIHFLKILAHPVFIKKLKIINIFKKANDK